MKRKLALLLACVLMISGLMCACGKNGDQSAAQPDLLEIRSICDLATLECYFHNVAKSTKEKGEGITHLFEVDRTFWIEYTGSAKIGIDLSQVEMEVKDADIKVTLPAAKVLSYKVEEINEDSYILSQDSMINKNKIAAEEQRAAVAQAQEEMKASVENNTVLLKNAQDRAKKLIENYITQLGEVSGVAYNIIWK